MAPRALGVDDVSWAVDVLARRRQRLAGSAPLYWRAAADAGRVHHEFLTHVLSDDGGMGCRTDHSLMIAARGPRGWTVDDAWIPAGRWASEGVELWDFLARRAGDGAPVRFVAPTFEPERTAFATARELMLQSSWWHREVATPGAAVDSTVEVRIDGASAMLVPAPPVYDPGGPILFLRELADPASALVAADAEARRLGCPLVVVEQSTDRRGLGEVLTSAGFVRHCDFFEGTFSTRARG